MATTNSTAFKFLAILSVLVLWIGSNIPTGDAQSAEHVIIRTQRNLLDQKNFNELVGDELHTEFAQLFAFSIEFSRKRDSSPPLPAWLAMLLKFLQDEANKLTNKVSQPCRDGLQQLADGVMGGAAGGKNKTWAFKFLDASGKLGSGFLEGNQQVIGSFAECLDIGSDPASPLQSRYCTTVVGVKPSTTGGNNPEMVSAAVGLSVGTCLPAKCTTEDSSAIFTALLNETMDRVKQLQNVTVLQAHCDSNVDTFHFNGPAIVAIVILSIGGFLLVAGTLVDAALRILAQRQAANNPSDPTLAKDIERSSILIQLLLCWSALRNGSKILAVESTKSVRSGDAAPPSLHCIHGIRFISMCWVIYCHTYAFSVAALKDPARFINDVGKWYFQPLSNASFSVDTFFFLSGMLLAYVVTAQERHHKRINWVQYYVHRYWRLTPPYMLTLAVFAGIFKYLSWGPLWNPDSWFPNQCAYSWWTNILYVNNFFQLEQGCMAWSWYLANDMQFYVISPLFIIPFFYRKSFGIIAWSILMLAFFAATISVTVYYKLPASLVASARNMENPSLFWTYFTVYYVKPWTRIGPYLVGVAFGYVLYQAKTKNWRLKSWMTAIGWPAALAISAAIIFPLVDENAGRVHLSLTAASLYNILSRPAWGIVLGFVIFACETGSGGFINTVFSFPGFIPLSRLAYCAYLVHPAIQMFTYGAMTAQFSYSIVTLSILGFGYIFAAFCLAFIVSLLFEAPALGLEKLLTSLLTKKSRGASHHGGVDNGTFTHSDISGNDEAGSAPTVRVASPRSRSAVAPIND